MPTLATPTMEDMGADQRKHEDSWLPLSVRQGEPDDYIGPHDGVPPWLVTSLLSWLESALDRVGESAGQRRAYVQRMERRLRRWVLLRSPGVEGEEVSEVILHVQSDMDSLLDVVDYILDNPPPQHGAWESTGPDPDWLWDSLESALREAGSVWTVHGVQGQVGLARRVTPGLSSLAERAMSGQDPAAELLAQAWRDAYGRHPDPDDAYVAAIKAVEAAAKGTVLPADTAATLTKMANALADAPAKWSIALVPGAEEAPRTIADLMRVLMKGHTNRHGSDTVDDKIDGAKAEAAVALAVFLVEWFRQEAIARRHPI